MASNASEDLLATELDAALRLERSPGPPDKSTVLVVAPPLLPPQVPAEQDTASPNSAETTEPPLSSSQHQQQQQPQQDNSADCDNDNGNNNNNNETLYRKKYTILCDMAYGMPSEARPRKEKIRAIARQLVNFLSWQQQQSMLPSLLQPAQIKIVGCDDAAIEQSLKDRMLELWVQEQQAATGNSTSSSSADKPVAIDSLPSNLTFTHQSLESFLASNTTTPHTNGATSGDPGTTKEESGVHHGHAGHERQDIVYLSPDAEATLDAASSQSGHPHSFVVVGLLIDRKHIQVDRSLKRAHALNIPAVRWPLEKIQLVQQQEEEEEEEEDKGNNSTAKAITLHASEPLNCDCILEGMQQWYWNYETYKTQEVGQDDNGNKKQAREACLSEAILQALQHHVERHPGRPIHKKNR